MHNPRSTRVTRAGLLPSRASCSKLVANSESHPRSSRVVGKSVSDSVKRASWVEMPARLSQAAKSAWGTDIRWTAQSGSDDIDTERTLSIPCSPPGSGGRQLARHTLQRLNPQSKAPIPAALSTATKLWWNQMDVTGPGRLRAGTKPYGRRMSRPGRLISSRSQGCSATEGGCPTDEPTSARPYESSLAEGGPRRRIQGDRPPPPRRPPQARR